MNTLRTYRHSRRAFTLVELLISIGIASAVFAGILSAGVLHTKMLAVADDYSAESQAELRAMDYIIRDLRRATTVSISTGGNSVSLTMPDCYTAYDTAGNPTGSLVLPTISNGQATYGNAATPLLVSYSVSGSQLIRTQTVQSTGAVSLLVVCGNVNNFQLAFVQQSTTVTFKITFSPKFQLASAALTAGTTLSGTASVRSIRFQ